MKKILITGMLVVFAAYAHAQFTTPDKNIFASAIKYEPSGLKTNLYIDDDETGSTDKEEASGYLGFRIMPTFSTFDVQKVDNNTVETTAILSWGYGGLIGFNTSDHVGFQLEVIYSPLAQKYKDASGENTIKLTYINIPLMMVLNTSYHAPVNFNIAFGPQIGINTGSEIDAGADGNGMDTVHAVVSVKSGDLGFAYGAGLDFGLGTANSIRLSLGFRGVYGLLDISDKSQTITTDQYYVLDRAHIKTYSGYVGLTFNF